MKAEGCISLLPFTFLSGRKGEDCVIKSLLGLLLFSLSQKKVCFRPAHFHLVLNHLTLFSLARVNLPCQDVWGEGNAKSVGILGWMKPSLESDFIGPLGRTRKACGSREGTD